MAGSEYYDDRSHHESCKCSQCLYEASLKMGHTYKTIKTFERIFGVKPAASPYGQAFADVYRDGVEDQKKQFELALEKILDKSIGHPYFWSS